MKASTKRISSISISILIFVVLLVFYTYLIQPAYSDIKEKRAEVAGKLVLINEYETALVRINNLLGQYDSFSQIQDTVSLILPPNQNVPRAVSQFTGLASINRLAIENLGVQQLAIKPSLRPSLVKGLGTLRLTGRLNGDYESFKAFLGNLETNIGLTDLVSLKIEPLAKGKIAENKFAYMMVVDMYYQAE